MIPAAQSIVRMTAATLVVCAAALPCHALFSSKYRIRLDRTYAVGMETRETITIENILAIQRGTAKVPKTEKQKTVLECTIKVLAVVDKHWQKIAVTPTSFTFPGMSKDKRFTAIGKAILITRMRTGIVFQRHDGQSLRASDKALLKPFFVQPPAVSAQAVFGTEDEVKVGDTWAINKLKLCQMMNLSSNGLIEAMPAAVTGNFKLSRVWKHQGKRYLQVGGAAHFRELTLKSGKFARLHDRKTTAVLKLNFELPLTGSAPAARMEQTFEWRVTGKEVVQGNVTPFVMANQLKQQRIIQITKNPQEGN